MVARVMIAEDEIALVSFYQNFLSNENDFKVIGFSTDGESALKMYRDTNPDILLLDLGLPKLNGIELIKQLSENTEEKNKCNIIVISGNNKLRLDLLNTQKVYSIIPKPANSNDIINAMHNLKNNIEKEYFPKSLAVKVLSQLHLKPYNRSSIVLLQTLELIYYEPELLDNLTNVYCRMAILHSYSEKKVQYTIRSSVDTIKRNINKQKLQSIFFMFTDDFYNFLSPKNFLSAFLLYLQEQQKKDS